MVLKKCAHFFSKLFACNEIYTRKSRCQNNRQKPISVASQEKKSQIATLVTDSVIPDYHKNDVSASIFGMMREERSLKFKFESLKP
jgi:hypothetical protein